MALSDLYSIEHNICYDIARKHSEAVDFSKTGLAAQSFRKKWQSDIPPEQLEYIPNFIKKNYQTNYSSNWTIIAELVKYAI